MLLRVYADDYFTLMLILIALFALLCHAATLMLITSSPLAAVTPLFFVATLMAADTPLTPERADAAAD